MNDDFNETPPRSGQTVELDSSHQSPHSAHKAQNLRSGTIEELKDQTTPLKRPESITDDPHTDNRATEQHLSSNLASGTNLTSDRFTLEPYSMRGIKPFLFSAAMLLAFCVIYELTSIFDRLMQTHPALGGCYLLGIGIVILAGGRALRNYYRLAKDDKHIEAIKLDAQHLYIKNDFGQCQPLLEKLDTLYDHKPQASLWLACKEKIPDYANDREVLQYIEQHFFRVLDKAALRKISDYCTTTGITIAISPFVSLDIALSLFRNLKMIEDVSQIYGIRPSLLGRWRLIKKVFNHMLLSASTEVALSKLFSDASSTLPFSPMHSVTQGIGVCVYSARIGLAAMQESRCLPFPQQGQPAIMDIVSGIPAAIRERLQA